MNITKTDSLFDLIHSLTKAEKVFFKRLVNDNSTNYVLLFDAIEKQKVYDEKQIIKKLEGKPFIKQLSVTKAHLLNKILESLRLFHSEKISFSKAFNLLLEIDILLNKRQFSQAKKTLNELELFVDITDLEYFTPFIVANRRMLFFLTQDIASNEKELIRFRTQLIQYSDKLRKSADAIYVADRYLLYRNTFNKKSAKEDTSLYNELKKTEQNENDLSLVNRLRLLDAKGNRAILCEDKNASIQLRVELMEMLIDNKEKLPKRNYLGLLYNSLQDIYFFERYDIVIKYVDFYLEEVKNVEYYKIFALNLQLNKAITLAMLGDKKQMMKEKKEVEEKTALLFKKEIDFNNYSFVYTLALFCHMIGDYKKTISWLNQLLTLNKKANLRSDILLNSLILQALCHIDKDNFDLLPYLINFIKSTLETEKTSSTENLVLIAFLEKASQAISDKEINRIFQDFNQELQDILAKENKWGSTYLNLRYFVAWSKSKINNTNTLEELRKLE